VVVATMLRCSVEDPAASPPLEHEVRVTSAAVPSASAVRDLTVFTWVFLWLGLLAV
jgi:hypothetical protein